MAAPDRTRVDQAATTSNLGKMGTDLLIPNVKIDLSHQLGLVPLCTLGRYSSNAFAMMTVRSAP